MAKKQVNKFFISGRVIEVGMPVRYSEKMSKANLVLEVYVDNYRQEVLFEYINSNMSLINGIVAGDWVNIDFVLKGRKFITKDQQAKHFNSLEGISCTKEE